MINFLRWNDVPRTSRIFSPKNAIFSQFLAYLSITRAKQIIDSLLLNNFYPVIIIHRRVQRRKPRIILYGSVARYGPQNQREGVKSNILYSLSPPQPLTVFHSPPKDKNSFQKKKKPMSPPLED